MCCRQVLSRKFLGVFEKVFFDEITRKVAHEVFAYADLDEAKLFKMARLGDRFFTEILENSVKV